MEETKDQTEDRTRFWMKELEGVTRERLGREARAAVTLNDIKGAARCGEALILRGASARDSAKLGAFLAEALAGLARDRDRSGRVIQIIARSGAIKERGVALDENFAKAVARPATGFEESNREWTQVLNAAAASLEEYCPRKNQTGEPSPADLSTFIGEITAVLRAGLAKNPKVDFLDALAILKDYCPTDPSIYPSVAGVEQRMFLSLGPAAKLTAVRGIARLGQDEKLRSRVLETARSVSSETHRSTLIAVMGGMRHHEFFPYLKNALKQAKAPHAQEAAIDALGRIANPGAIDLILAELEKCMKKSLDPKEELRAKRMLTALGRIARSRDLDTARRHKLVKQVIQCVGERSSRVTLAATEQMFSVDVAGLDRSARSWAVRQLMRALFSIDSGEDMLAATRSPAGFRQPIVATLIRLGKQAAPEMLELASQHIASYSGAFPAFADVLLKVGDERAVPLLESMIRTACLHDEDEPKSSLLREKVHDAATGETHGLDLDDGLHSLLYALDKIGGPAGQRVMRGLADQVQAGQLTAFGTKSASILVAAKRKRGTLGKMEDPGEEEEEFTSREIDKAVAHAKGGLFGGRRKQIAGLALLGRARRPHTIPAVLRCLEAKEPVIVAAAEAALIQFVTPPPRPKAYERLIMNLIGEPKLLRGARLERLLQIVARHFPKQEPYDGVFKKQVAIELEEGELTHRLLGAIHTGEKVELEPEDGEEDGSKKKKPKGPALTTAETRQEIMELKRQFLEQRRAWVRGGKKGPEPKPPPGFN